jgi:hypothetical protein
MTGKLELQADGKYKFCPYCTNLKDINYNMFCCCSEEEVSNIEINTLYKGKKNREEVLKIVESEHTINTSCLRICSYILHFVSYYMKLYSILLIIGMIPLFGAVGGLAIILIALLFSLITYLLIIGSVWVFARPYISTILFSAIIVLIIVTRIISDYIRQDDDGSKSVRLANRVFMEESNFLDY